jgi:hypothetical protein
MLLIKYMFSVAENFCLILIFNNQIIHDSVNNILKTNINLFFQKSNFVTQNSKQNFIRQKIFFIPNKKFEFYCIKICFYAFSSALFLIKNFEKISEINKFSDD